MKAPAVVASQAGDGVEPAERARTVTFSMLTAAGRARLSDPVRRQGGRRGLDHRRARQRPAAHSSVHAPTAEQRLGQVTLQLAAETSTQQAAAEAALV